MHCTRQFRLNSIQLRRRHRIDKLLRKPSAAGTRDDDDGNDDGDGGKTTAAVDNDDGQTNGRHVSSHYAFKRCKRKWRE